MKNKVLGFGLVFLLAGMTGCDQKQSELLALREETQRENKATENTINDLRAQVTSLKEQKAQLETQLRNSSTEATTKLADQVNSILLAQTASNTTSFNEIKASLDEIKKSMQGVAYAPPAAPGVGAQAKADPNHQRLEWSDQSQPSQAAPSAPVQSSQATAPSGATRGGTRIPMSW